MIVTILVAWLLAAVVVGIVVGRLFRARPSLVPPPEPSRLQQMWWDARRPWRRLRLRGDDLRYLQKLARTNDLEYRLAIRQSMIEVLGEDPYDDYADLP